MKSQVINVNTKSPEFKAELLRRVKIAKNPEKQLSISEARKLTNKYFQRIRTKV